MVSSITRHFTTYTIDMIRADVRYFVERKIVNRHQSISSLIPLIPLRERANFERQLELHEFLLRDRIGDLIAAETWSND